MSKNQVAMVMDLNKCIGCQTCTVACKRLWTRREGMDSMWWNTVNTAPGKGTPKGWEDMGGGFKDGHAVSSIIPTINEYGEAFDLNYKEALYSKAGTKQLKPQNDVKDWSPNWDEDVGGGEGPEDNHFFYLPRICNHCTRPACREACPRGAIEKREEDGIVLINEDRCRGYRFCQEACPYKKIYYNEELGVSQKCIFCLPRVEKGVANACARQCPGRVRFVGYLNDEEGPIHKLVHEWKVALPLHAEYGTSPNVFYVPPSSGSRLNEHGEETNESRIPPEYLESLFGPGVHDALKTIESEREKRTRGEPSELMEILITKRWLDRFGPFDKHPRDVKS